MKTKLIFTLLLILVLGYYASAQHHSVSAKVNIGSEVVDHFQKDGRIYLFISENLRVEPRTQTWPSPSDKTYIFAKEVSQFDLSTGLDIITDKEWISTSDWSLDEVPEGEYNIQVLWDQDSQESRIDAPNNLYSEKQRITIGKSLKLDFVIDKAIEQRSVASHRLAKMIEIQSEVLTKWWDKPVHLKAAILLPHGYDPQKTYPIRYNVAGYGGRYTRVNRLIKNENFMKWWDSEEAPQIINVFLDGEGPFGDSYQMDSDNSGPYGEALITEFIPAIESKYRGSTSSSTRFVDGCSTGGWVSLGLQLYYPETFNGVFSYSPDAVEFTNYQLINIYEDKNAFVNEFGYKRPVMRSTAGEPMLSLKEFIQYENVLGSSNSYLDSGGQFSAHTALYSPKGSNDLPQPLFDRMTGVIDADVANHWKKYDFKIHTEQNWDELGPKLQGKIFIWMGDMDHFYLNHATREFSDYLSKTINPTSDAEIIFTPMEGHCSQFSNKVVLQQMQERLKKIEE
ncbi:MAG: enterochelin esterase-like enzyme [Saprospiraceae bacterium]|jgi:enterochelin esterase-like enzyme